MAEPNPSRDEARQQAIREALAELRAEYAEGLPTIVGELTAAAEKANASSSDVDFRHLQTLAHRMHGAAGSYGFKGTSEAAAKLEELLTAREKSPLAERAASAAAIAAALTGVQETVRQELADFLATRQSV